MKTSFKITLKTVLFIALTLLTQIGGIVYLLSIAVNHILKSGSILKKLCVFLGIYFLFTLLIVPLIAPSFGREKVIHNNKISPTNYSTVLLNRNYVSPKLNRLLRKAGEKLNDTPVEIHYLDANFPFINKFPLLPHLSHNDGKKIDLSLIYKTKDGKISTDQKSISGYGVFEVPRGKEHNQPEMCKKKDHFQYDYPKYLTLGKINVELEFSKKGTKKLIQSLLAQKELGKLFIEPHLKQRLGLNYSKVRYHGCHAVRHDDHIHVEIQ